MTDISTYSSTKEKYFIENFFKGKQFDAIRCPVDTENYFSYKNKLYLIDEKVKSYKVHNKPKKQSNGKWNDWTNEAEMDSVYVVEKNNRLHVFDQKFYRIHPSLIIQL